MRIEQIDLETWSERLRDMELMAHEANPPYRASIDEADQRHFYATQVDEGFALLDNKELTGFLLVSLTGTSLEIEDIAVHPQHHGKGYGRALMQHAEEVARANGFVSVKLLTSIDNENAQAFYHRLGYERVALVDNYDGRGEPGYRFIKTLNATA